MGAVLRHVLSPGRLRLGYRAHEGHFAHCRGPVSERSTLFQHSEVTTVTLVGSRSSCVYLCVCFMRPLCLSSALQVSICLPFFA
uniref:Uncharacterized protein n=1 Tax=Rhipicephalus zambeziensis TaxID=60191 RepID=A0A224YFI6_9ACAR